MPTSCGLQVAKYFPDAEEVVVVVEESDGELFEEIIKPHQETAPFPIRVVTEPDIMNGHIQQKYSKVRTVRTRGLFGDPGIRRTIVTGTTRRHTKGDRLLIDVAHVPGGSTERCFGFRIRPPAMVGVEEGSCCPS